MIAEFFNLIGDWLYELMILDQPIGIGEAVAAGGKIPPASRSDEHLSHPTLDHRD